MSGAALPDLSVIILRLAQVCTMSGAVLPDFSVIIPRLAQVCTLSGAGLYDGWSKLDFM